ncbi:MULTISPECIES: fimbrial protein [Providencia]|uniref:Type 1 fimbrial protein n=3 Tax=Providencia TaxID=586 RepID=A0AAI9GKX4_PROST|nr:MULTISPECIES: fimbrial protein [Providencia]ELR5114881.1 type 1 fimbrial protein [Providencia stuartii]MDX4945809.1 fimbrial protein [Providencia manganoxydans]MTB79059.1 fimbrial protein [Providencia stuartii]QQO61958.1 type 1 fimbrial protein [Providencia manganoxydans]HEF8774091.1 type 1 fimbrial protein [Providencia stuartii]
MNKYILFFSCMLFLNIVQPSYTYAKNGQIGEVRVRGELIAEPCVIRPGDEEIEVDFGTIVDKYLYINTRSHIESYVIHLEDCDTSIFNTVDVTFVGNENPNLPGLLALDSNSVATRVGIAILDESENIIEINTPTPAYKLNNGNNELRFKAYVEAELDAIKSKSIGLGAFTATATFKLFYD